MSYLIYLIVFVVTFFLTMQLFPKEGEREIRERLVAAAGGEKKRSFWIGFLVAFAPLNRPLKLMGLREKTKGALSSAGSSLSAEEFFVLKELFAIFLPVIYVIFVGMPSARPIWIVSLVGLGLFLPSLWLRQRIRARHEAIIKALPNVMDLLSLAVGAGLDFMVAVKKMVERSEKNPLVNELYQVWQETNMGATRRNALQNMARRLNAPQISSFVRTLVQADKMGTTLEEVLRLQSEEALDMRFQRAERAALKAPIKMLIPLILFIMPVVGIVVGGPIFLRFFQGGFSLH